MKSSQMSLTDYPEFSDKDDIRIRETRVGSETVVSDYPNAFGPEESAIRYPTPMPEQIYAAITYYLRNKRQWEQYSEESWKEQSGSPAIRRLIELKNRRKSDSGAFPHEEAMLSC